MDFESGRKVDKRDEFQRLIGDAGAHEFDAVLIFHTSRFARNTIEAKHNKKLLRSEQRIEVISVTQPLGDANDPAAFLAESVHEIFDEYYSVSLSFWTTMGLKEKARQGFLTGGLACDASGPRPRTRAARLRTTWTSPASAASSTSAASGCATSTSSATSTAPSTSPSRTPSTPSWTPSLPDPPPISTAPTSAASGRTRPTPNRGESCSSSSSSWSGSTGRRSSPSDPPLRLQLFHRGRCRGTARCKRRERRDSNPRPPA
jgi:DNA invertase Pin-like site-specific DNA recombinase